MMILLIQLILSALTLRKKIIDHLQIVNCMLQFSISICPAFLLLNAF